MVNKLYSRLSSSFLASTLLVMVAATGCQSAPASQTPGALKGQLRSIPVGSLTHTDDFDDSTLFPVDGHILSVGSNQLSAVNDIYGGNTTRYYSKGISYTDGLGDSYQSISPLIQQLQFRTFDEQGSEVTAYNKQYSTIEILPLYVTGISIPAPYPFFRSWYHDGPYDEMKPEALASLTEFLETYDFIELTAQQSSDLKSGALEIRFATALELLEADPHGHGERSDRVEVMSNENDYTLFLQQTPEGMVVILDY